MSLVQVIQSLGKRERADLLRWIESPFTGYRPEVRRLCQHLCEEASPGDNDGTASNTWNKSDVYGHVFGKKTTMDRKEAGPDRKLLPSEDSALRYTLSALFMAVKQWLAWREWSQETTATKLYLCRSLRKRGLTQVFEKEFKSAALPAPDTRQSIDFHLIQYQFQLEYWEARHHSGQADPEQLRSMCSSFGAFVALSTLRHGCAALDKPGAGLPVEAVDFLPEVLSKVEAGQYGQVPAVQVYYHCFRLMQTQKEAHFQALKLLLTEHTSIFPREEIRDVWLVAINYCIRRLNTGERSWVQEAFELYRSGLERGLLLDHGNMPKATYQNIMLLAIASNEWIWARQFLDDYRPALVVGERHNAYHFNLALWHFRRKEYPEAQHILRSVEFRDVHYNLDARRMMVRMYYDDGSVSALDSLLHSFRTYLLRHRNIGYHRDLNANFVRAVQRLIALKPGDHAARERLRQKFSSEKYLAEREWLLEKI